MRKLIILLVATATVCFGVKAQNTVGTVGFWPQINSQNKTIALTCSWSQNDSFIQPNFYWDTVPTLYRMHDTLGVRYYDKEGSATVFVKPYRACTQYYCKLQFIDGRTGQSYTITNYLQTSGDKKPDAKLQISQIGFSFVQLSMNIDGHCNGFNWTLSYTENGKLPNIQYNESAGDIFSTSRSLFGMTPNKNYNISLNISNSFGDTTIVLSVTTISNLSPIVESTSATSNDTTSVTCGAFIDPQNTTSTSFRIEYGKDINLGESSGWIDVNSKGNWGVGVGGLDPGTVYFWRAVGKNEFGHDEGQIKLFKTKGLAITTGIEEITWNDLLHVSSCPSGIFISAEKNMTAEIYSISGRKISTVECMGEKIVQMDPGFYIIKAKIAGKEIIKKALVN